MPSKKQPTATRPAARPAVRPPRKAAAPSLASSAQLANVVLLLGAAGRHVLRTQYGLSEAQADQWLVETLKIGNDPIRAAAILAQDLRR